MALRKYREREAESLLENRRERIRAAGRKLLAREQLKVREAEALILYLGLEDNGWRTHLQVAQLMKISGERVCQLLAPSKAALASTLNGEVPWRLRKRFRKQRASGPLLEIDSVIQLEISARRKACKGSKRSGHTLKFQNGQPLIAVS